MINKNYDREQLCCVKQDTEQLTFYLDTFCDMDTHEVIKLNMFVEYMDTATKYKSSYRKKLSIKQRIVVLSLVL